MSAILRASGDEFDVDSFLAECTLAICAVKRRGAPVFPASQPDGPRHQKSAVHISASDADFAEFPRQVAEATLFLRSEAEQIRRLCMWPGIDGVDLDFGIERRDVAVQCDRLPLELIRLAASLGLAIEISQYGASEKENSELGSRIDAPENNSRLSRSSR